MKTRIKNFDKEDLSIINIWNLKADLDEAVSTKNYNDIQTIKLIYERLVSNTKYHSHIFYSNQGYKRESDRYIDYAKNVNALLRNIEDHIDKYIYNENISVKLKKSKCECMAYDIWIMREMYDDFLLKNTQGNNLLEQYNMTFGRSLIEHLEYLAHDDDDYYYQLKPILYEVREGYRNKYGDKFPKSSYYQFRKDYEEETENSILTSSVYGGDSTNKSLTKLHKAPKEDNELSM